MQPPMEESALVLGEGAEQGMMLYHNTSVGICTADQLILQRHKLQNSLSHAHAHAAISCRTNVQLQCARFVWRSIIILAAMCDGHLSDS